MPRRRRPRRRPRSKPPSRPRKAETARPTLICCKTIIGWGSPNKQGTEATHGAALGADEVAATRASTRLDARAVRRFPTRSAPAGTRVPRRRAPSRPGSERFAAYRAAHPELAAEFERRMRGELPATGVRSSTSSSPRPAAKPRGRRDAPSSQLVAECARRRACPNCSAARPTSPAPTTPTARTRRRSRADDARQLPLLRRARVRHDRDHERHGAARRLHSVRRHVPGVLGLRAQCRAHGGADEAARHARATPTIPSASARTARRTSRSSTWRACA